MLDPNGNIEINIEKENATPDQDGRALEKLITRIDSEIETSQAKTKEVPETPDRGTAGEYGNEQYIRFTLANLYLAIPLESATEVGPAPEIVSLPNLPDWILGVSNIRGEIISMLDLSRFLELSTTKATLNKRFIVTQNNEMKIGILVDRILGIISLDKMGFKVQSSPYKKGKIAPFIENVAPGDDYLLNIFNIDKLLSSAPISRFRAE